MIVNLGNNLDMASDYRYYLLVIIVFGSYCYSLGYDWCGCLEPYGSWCYCSYSFKLQALS